MRLPENPWIQCDICKSWWHLECACLDVKSAKKIESQKIYFPCAFCVLKHLKVNITLGTSETKPETENILENNSDKFGSVKAPIHKDSPIQLINPDHMLVVDSIANPRTFSSTKKIEEKVTEKQIDGVDFAYSLPQGGVVLQFQSQDSRDKAEENLPQKVFDKEEAVHRPTSKLGKKEDTYVTLIHAFQRGL